MLLSDFDSYIKGTKTFKINDQSLESVRASHKFLENFAKDKIIYGINTGFGPMAQYKIAETDQVQLQYNLIRSHASGQGAPLNPSYTKAVMLCRVNTLCLGFSGVSIDVVKQLETYIQNEIYPIIPTHGGVGASGDLVQLAHLALGLIGEGTCWYKGKIEPVEEVLKELEIAPLELKLRDGLALINGTSCMSGIGMINLIDAQKLLEWSTKLGAIINELVESYDDSFSEPLNASKKHPGQQTVARNMRKALKDSLRIKKREEHLFKNSENESSIPNREKVQEYYSFRCIPQILGPILDEWTETKTILENEINSANDNPIIDVEKQNVYHGGNFHGDYVSYAMDKLKIGITKLGMLSERQLNYLLNDKLNDRFPPFLNMGKLGFNFGIQGIQFTATSTAAENQSLSFPMSVHSISNNNDNQDIVSMGTNAASIFKNVLDNTFEVIAIESIAVAQAIDCLPSQEGLSTTAKEFYKEIRTLVKPILDDRPLSSEISGLKNHIKLN